MYKVVENPFIRSDTINCSQDMCMVIYPRLALYHVCYGASSIFIKEASVFGDKYQLLVKYGIVYPSYLTIGTIVRNISLSSSPFIAIDRYSHVIENLARITNVRYLPLPWNPAQRRVFELLRVGVGIAEAALRIEAASEEVVQQPGLDMAQLGDDALGSADGLVRRV